MHLLLLLLLLLRRVEVSLDANEHQMQQYRVGGIAAIRAQLFLGRQPLTNCLNEARLDVQQQLLLPPRLAQQLQLE